MKCGHAGGVRANSRWHRHRIRTIGIVCTPAGVRAPGTPPACGHHRPSRTLFASTPPAWLFALTLRERAGERLRARLGRAVDRQMDGERRTDAALGLHLDPSSQYFRKALRERKSEAGALLAELAAFIGLMEVVEDLRDLRLADADALIADDEADRLPSQRRDFRRQLIDAQLNQRA